MVSLEIIYLASSVNGYFQYDQNDAIKLHRIAQNFIKRYNIDINSDLVENMSK